MIIEGMRATRDPRYRETHVVIPDEAFEREGQIMYADRGNGTPLTLHRKPIEAAVHLAYQLSPQAFIDHMREKKRRNYLRRFPWLRAK